MKTKIKKADYDKKIDQLMKVRSILNELCEEFAELVPEDSQDGDDPASTTQIAYDSVQETLDSLKNQFEVE